MKCEYCGQQATGNIHIRQTLKTVDRMDEEEKQEIKQKIYCDKDCLNQWKWETYYSYREVDTHSRSVSKPGQRSTA